jgi:hypothetical protein
MSEDSEKVQCPCGRIINDPEEYKVLFLKRELKEVDILCPNDSCYLRELGYVKFDIKDGKAKFKEASFYPPFVTWNAGRLTENTEKLLKDHLKRAAKKLDWEKLGEEKKE